MRKVSVKAGLIWGKSEGNCLWNQNVFTMTARFSQEATKAVILTVFNTYSDNQVISVIYYHLSILTSVTVHTLRLTQNGRHFIDDTFKCVFLNQNMWIRLIFHVSLFLRVQLAISQYWFRQWFGAVGDKPLLPESMLTQFTDAYRRH